MSIVELIREDMVRSFIRGMIEINHNRRIELQMDPFMTMTQKEKQDIVSALSKRGANRSCPRCNQDNFTLLDGYLNQSIQKTLTENIVFSGFSIPSVPSVVVVCNNCGFMNQHALGVLGLMPKNQ